MVFPELTLMHASRLPWLRPKHHAGQLFILFVLLFVTQPARSELNYTYRASLGVSAQIFDTDVTIRSQDESIDKEIDLEDDLGFTNDINAGWLRGIYRMANRHRLSLTYTPIRRNAETVSTKDIIIEDAVIKAGASIETSAKTDVFDIEYLYSFYKRPHTEISISGGLYWMSYNFELKAAGEIVIDGSEEVLRTDYETNLKLNAPLPLLGMSGTYEINPRWEVHAGVRYFYVSINDIEGQIISAGVGTDYFITKHWGLGLSLSTFNLEVEKDGILFKNALTWKFDGAQLYIVFKY